MAVNRGVRAGRRRILPPSDPNWSQADQRRGQIMYDDHERPWHANIELDSGDPTGLIDPQFTAPLIPHQKYLEMVPDDPRRLHINYDAWKRDIRTERRRWDRDARQRSQVRYGERYDPKAPITAEIIDIIGQPPEPIEPIIAAQQGNRWVLGVTDKVDPRLERFFEWNKPDVAEPDFRDIDEPDFSDTAPPARDWRLGELEEEDLGEELEEEHDRGAVGGKRVDPRSARPQARVTQRGSGGRKGEGGKGKTTGKRSTPAKAGELATA